MVQNKFEWVRSQVIFWFKNCVMCAVRLQLKNARTRGTWKNNIIGELKEKRSSTPKFGFKFQQSHIEIC